MICGESVEAPETRRTRSRLGSPGPLSSLQIVPLAVPPLQLPRPRVHDDVTPAAPAVGAPITLNSHCTAPELTADAEAGQVTAPAAAPETPSVAAAVATAIASI